MLPCSTNSYNPLGGPDEYRIANLRCALFHCIYLVCSNEEWFSNSESNLALAGNSRYNLHIRLLIYRLQAICLLFHRKFGSEEAISNLVAHCFFLAVWSLHTSR